KFLGPGAASCSPTSWCPSTKRTSSPRSTGCTTCPTAWTISSSGCAQPASTQRSCGHTRTWPSCALDARADQDEVGREPEKQPEQDSPGDDRLRGERAADVQQLHHDVEDGARRQREEHDHHALVDPRLTDHSAEEGRRSTDQAEQGEEAPARLLLVARQRRADAEPLGRVVQAEPDDQDDREADLVGCGRLPDRKPLGEV